MLSEYAPYVVQRTRELCNTFDGLYLILVNVEKELLEVFSEHAPKVAVQLSHDAVALRSHVAELDSADELMAVFMRGHERFLATAQRFNRNMTAVIDFAEERDWALKRQDISYDGVWIGQELDRLQAVARNLNSTHLTMQRHFSILFDSSPTADSFDKRILKRKTFEKLAAVRDEYFHESTTTDISRYVMLAEAGVNYDYAWDFSIGGAPKLSPEQSALADALLSELIRDELMVSVLNDCEELSHGA